MKHEQLITELNTIVETACKQPSNIYGYGIWSHHIVHVVKYAKLLASHLNADQEVVEIAAILHDYASIKNKDFVTEHHIIGAQLAGEILTNHGYPMDKIRLVQNCIICHRGSKPQERTTPEAHCVASADGMAHIDQVVSLLYSVYKEQNMGIEAGRIWVKSKLERTWNKLCPQAQEIVRNKYQAAMAILG
jgi:uncharacterized protein